MSVLLAMVLDAIFGEPKWLWSRFPHPAVLMGKCVSFIDTSFNKGTHRKDKGIASFAILVVMFALLGMGLQDLPGFWAEAIIGAMLLAQKSLVEHVSDVAKGLRTSVEAGRASVAMIVGRDTAELDEPAVARAAIESAAENFSDGVLAPLFWFAVGGLPGLLIYKITNTADSMIGYRTPRHEQFGWAAARFDDLLNLIPARLTAILFVALKPNLWQFSPIRKDAGLHRSPNAGWPEAALSRVLGIALSGPRAYHGEMRDYPWVNADGRKDATAEDVDRAVRELWRAWGIAFVVILGITFI